jgi:hypothetical protein
MSKLWPNAFELSEQLEADAKQVPPPIRIGFGRYVGSFSEKLPEDRLLDYVIGLEALLSFAAQVIEGENATLVRALDLCSLNRRAPRPTRHRNA